MEDRMNMLWTALLPLLLVFLSLPPVVTVASPAHTLTTEAQTWLKLIDAGEHGRNWRAAGYFIK